MSGQPSDVPQTVAGIEAAFGGRWGVWLSDTGCWWATRIQGLSAEDLTAGCVPYVQAETPEELTERMREQDQLTPAAKSPPDGPESAAPSRTALPIPGETTTGDHLALP